jgi:hypothetical protein
MGTYIGIETVYDEEKYFVLSRQQQPGQTKNLLYRRDKPNEQLRKCPVDLTSFGSFSPQQDFSNDFCTTLCPFKSGWMLPLK